MPRINTTMRLMIQLGSRKFWYIYVCVRVCVCVRLFHIAIFQPTAGITAATTTLVRLGYI